MDVLDDGSVSLDTIKGGAIIERFNDELKQVIANCLDPNTSDGVRQITLTVKIKPDAGRSLCGVIAAISSKVLPASPLATSMFIGMDPKLGPVAYENDPKQLGLFAKQEAAPAGPNVVTFPDKEANNA